MTDKTITENDEDELIAVEDEQPEDDQSDEQSEDSDDEDEGDERLAESEEDSEEDITTSTNRDRRRKRREIQKRARDAAKRELEELRRTVAVLSQRVAQSETQFTTQSVAQYSQNLEAQLARVQQDIRQAEAIMAKATEAGNGEDVVAAMRIRDQAMSEAQQLQAARAQAEQAKEQASKPRVDPNVVNFAKEWMEANPWYDPNGADRDSAMTKAIDNALAQEGYNPSSRLYWEELTARVADALGESEKPARRKAPPQGRTREHAPASTKKEIYVTPERKQAMIEAGVWDDPALRQRYLKAYQAYDTSAR